MKLFKSRRGLKRKAETKADKKAVSPFHAVEIRCASDACQAAQDTRGKRFISAEAPLLPLKQCDRSDHCQCRYQHYEDRRRHSGRRSEISSPTHGDTPRVERREGKDRRSETIAEDEKPFSVSEDSYYEHVGDKFRDMGLDDGESAGVDPYNSGSFDKSKSWKTRSRK